MKPFAFLQPTSVSEAIGLLASGKGQARVIAGGSDLLSELKDEVIPCETLVSLARIEELHTIESEGEGLRLGALVTLAQLEQEPRLSGPYGILAQAARTVATPEIRNQGTLGGNLCQHPRCLHYRRGAISCLKKGGTECPAVQSPHQIYLSVMGGQRCFAVHASDLAPPLIALGASVVLRGPKGERSLPLTQFFLGPEEDVCHENVLSSNELLTAVILPPQPSGWRGLYLKAREREAGDFPVVSVAIGCAQTAGVVEHIRMVLGGVAPVPRPCPEVEALLEGQQLTPDNVARAAEVAFADAKPLFFNGFKVDMGRALVASALNEIRGSD